MHPLIRAAAFCSVVSVLNVWAAAAQDPSSVAPQFSLRTSIKGSTLVFRAPDAPELFPERRGGESIWRWRVEPEMRWGTKLVLNAAYEQRLRYTSSGGVVTAAAILPSGSAAPFRVRALDWTLGEASGTTWRHELDRASAQWQTGRASITIGRQAVGWGRGVLFGAVDLFAPFSPIEADREWRRGIDAARADIKLTDRSSFELVGAFGDTWDRSAVAARLRGYAGTADLEVVAGRRARDLFAGVTSSAAVGDAEVHGELAAFHVPAGALAEGTRVVWKAVAGASYRFPVGSGILAYAEYHYSGFGARRPADLLALLGDERFLERYLRGDTQILSRHAIGLIASYEASPDVTGSGHWVHNPGDRSGIVVPGLTYTFSDELSLLGTVYVPYGGTPRGWTLRSEFGSAARAALLQVRLYL